MKIGSSTRSTPVAGNTSPAQARTDKPAEHQSVTQDNVSLSSASSHIQALESGIAQASGFDAGKVESLKQAVDDGRYQVDADTVANKLIASTRELLARRGQG
jgi:negative regulator of flagellin synthesis FlgM